MERKKLESNLYVERNRQRFRHYNYQVIDGQWGRLPVQRYCARRKRARHCADRWSRVHPQGEREDRFN